ncbi:peptide-methionine (S)-S-oxide reductase MsrA [Pontivivens ytuae]|uniref:Peptide methionine sulfoxide reductase MsrA n=1 Tax=Pontivivens ytuae TaxID=2789856 RepID=A0A7S9LRP8_9RHOB|nr:peptide-methionine (S)-S-oxide reductase MsrA [Pontivivens ytuae]QPH54061.1 peptide-methionine (S)-S-oxide reductase MsrA [Pontivivens ytuae]
MKWMMGLALAFGGTPAMSEEPARAVFAGGCFWCVEADFDKLDGVLETTSGFAGGTTEAPSYAEVVGGGTGHREVVEIVYDPEVVSFDTLAEHLFRTTDPLDGGGQFCDRGFAYTTAIYAQTPEQFQVATEIKARVEGLLEAEVETEIVEGGTFWPAEAYHQDYYLENPLRYNFYRLSCGRDRQVDRVWADVPLS